MTGIVPIQPILVFDVNETLLDLSALDPLFERYLGDARVRKEWFSQVLLIAFAHTISGPYADFGAVANAALDVVQARHHRQVADDARSHILGTLRRLSPHPDAEGGLRRLRDGGLRLVTLTNSTVQVAEAQLAHAGLRHHFEHVFSADAVRRLKPAPEPYRMVAGELGVETASLLLVAAHAWDVGGALGAGCRAAFIQRPGQVLDALTPTPAYVATDLHELADQLLRQGPRS